MEGLKIIILDQGIERLYETYSGAEKFLIDLSFRIGASKFLTERAGAEIKILVLDEGLGSLDKTNCISVIEVIKEMGDYFEMILVITHIDELKDAFEQKIEISRNSNGSKVKVIV